MAEAAADVRRRLLPAGATGVGSGLLVLGLSSYAYLALAGRALAPADFATLSVLYVLVYSVGIAFFLPLEQEVGRAVADRRTRGEGAGPVLRRASVLGLGIVGMLILLAAVGGPTVVGLLFDGSWLVLLALVVSWVALWAAHLSRGALAGHGRFKTYGAQLAVEGVVRVIGCAALAALSVDSTWPYGLLLGAATLVSVLVTVPRPQIFDRSGPPAAWREVLGSLGWLLVAALGSAVLVNGGPVAVELLAGPGDAAAAGALLAGLVLARLPLFIFGAVQASLLPNLAVLLAAGRKRDFNSGCTRLLLGITFVTFVATLTAGLLGPEAIGFFFGPQLTLTGGEMARLAAASGAYMAAVALSQPLIAMRCYARTVAGWAVGCAIFGLVMLLVDGLIGRVIAGYLWGSIGAAAAFVIMLASAVRGYRPPLRARQPLDNRPQGQL